METRYGVVGQSFTVEADTTDCMVVFGLTLASVTGANAPAFATVGTVNASGIYTNTAGGNGLRVTAGSGGALRFNLRPNVDRFMAFVATGAGVIRFYQSSDSSP